MAPPIKREVRPVGASALRGPSRVQFKGDRRPQQTLLDRFMKVAEIGSKVAVQAIDEIAETDRVKQIDRFRQGLAPTDDATVAGYRAHSLLKMKRVIGEQESILLDKSSRFTGTLPEWQAEVMKSKSDANEAIIKDSPNILKDQQFMKAQNLMFEDAYSTVAMARVEDGLKIERQERLTTFGMSVVDVLESDPKSNDITRDLDRLVNVYSFNLQLSPKEVIPMMEEIVTNDLQRGRMKGLEWAMGYTVDTERGLSLFDTSPTLQKGLETSQTKRRNENETRLNNQFFSLQVRVEEENMSTEDYETELQSLKTGEVDHSSFDARISRLLTASRAKTQEIVNEKNKRLYPFIQDREFSKFIDLSKTDLPAAKRSLAQSFKDFPNAMSSDEVSNTVVRSLLKKGRVTKSEYDDSLRLQEIADNLMIKQLSRSVLREGTQESRDALSNYLPGVTARHGRKASKSMQESSMDEAVKDWESLNKEVTKAQWISTWKPHYGRLLGDLALKYTSGVIEEDELAIGYNEVMKDKTRRGFAGEEAWGLSKWESMLKSKKATDAKKSKLDDWLKGLRGSQTLFSDSPKYNQEDHARGIRHLNTLTNAAIEAELPGQDSTDAKKNVFDVRIKHKMPALQLEVRNGIYDRDLEKEFNSLSTQPLNYIDVSSRDFNLQSAPFNVVEKIKLYRAMPLNYRDELLKNKSVKAFWDNILSGSKGVEFNDGRIPESIWVDAYRTSHNTAFTSPKVEKELRELLPEKSGYDMLDSGSFLFGNKDLKDGQAGFLEGIYANRAYQEKGFGNGSVDSIFEDTDAFMQTNYKHSKGGHIIGGDQRNINRILFGNVESVGLNNDAVAVDAYLRSIELENGIVIFEDGGAVRIFDESNTLVGSLTSTETHVIQDAFLAESQEREEDRKRSIRLALGEFK